MIRAVMIAAVALADPLSCPTSCSEDDITSDAKQSDLTQLVSLNVVQWSLIVIKHLKENPAQLHSPALELVKNALSEDWPCN